RIPAGRRTSRAAWAWTSPCAGPARGPSTSSAATWSTGSAAIDRTLPNHARRPRRLSAKARGMMLTWLLPTGAGRWIGSGPRRVSREGDVEIAAGEGDARVLHVADVDLPLPQVGK